jgi:hypothetical protein
LIAKRYKPSRAVELETFMGYDPFEHVILTAWRIARYCCRSSDPSVSTYVHTSWIACRGKSKSQYLQKVCFICYPLSILLLTSCAFSTLQTRTMTITPIQKKRIVKYAILHSTSTGRHRAKKCVSHGRHQTLS